MDLRFNIRTDEQPEGGWSVVIVFEPQETEEKCNDTANDIALQLEEGLGWDVDRVN